MRVLGLLLTAQFVVMLAATLMCVGRGGIRDLTPARPTSAGPRSPVIQYMSQPSAAARAVQISASTSSFTTPTRRVRRR